MTRALEKLARWRNVFASWQLGTRLPDDGELRAVKDHREATILLRCEVTALAGLLMEKGLITVAEWEDAVEAEARQLGLGYEQRFPGFRASAQGIMMNLPDARDTMRRLGFPP